MGGCLPATFTFRVVDVVTRLDQVTMFIDEIAATVNQPHMLDTRHKKTNTHLVRLFVLVRGVVKSLAD